MSKVLSIIITHYKTPHLLKLALRSIKETCKEINYEIIVSDAEAQHETIEMLADEFPEVKHHAFKDNVGYARLVNSGIKNSQSDYVLILNADIVLLKDTAKTLIEYLKNNEKVGLVGPKLLNFSGTHQHSCFKFYKPFTVMARRTFLAKTTFGAEAIRKFLMEDELAANYNKPLAADWLMGSALCVKRSAMNKVGLMDERFFMYFEDVDWCRRFWENGFAVVYLPQALAYHYHQKASHTGRVILDIINNKQTRIHAASAYKYFRKYKNKPVPSAKL